MRKNPHVRICGGLGSATTLVYPTPAHPRDDPFTRYCKTFNPMGDTPRSDALLEPAVQASRSRG